MSRGHSYCMYMNLDIKQRTKTQLNVHVVLRKRGEGHSVTAAKYLQSSAGDEWLPLPILGKGTTLACGEP